MEMSLNGCSIVGMKITLAHLILVFSVSREITNGYDPMPFMQPAKQLRYGDREINWSKARAMLVRLFSVS